MYANKALINFIVSIELYRVILIVLNKQYTRIDNKSKIKVVIFIYFT